jgi:FAD/FMN-containing dehydrogenase
MDTVANALEPWDSDVKLANFVDVICYPPESFERLQQLKARYDPDNRFRANPAIPTAATAG